jgi:archaellum component FlaC
MQKNESRIENGFNFRKKFFSIFENKFNSLKNKFKILRYDHNSFKNELEYARETIKEFINFPKKYRAFSNRINSLKGDLLHKIDGRMKRKIEILKKDIFKKIKANLNKDRTLNITRKITGEFYLI